MNTILLALAVLPVIILGIVVYRQDKYQREPLGKLLKAFFFGALSIIPAFFMEQFLSYFTPGIPGIDGIFQGYIVAGCSEEFWKLAMLTLAIWRSREFDEYFDGIVYACFVSLGFACFENIGYVFGQESYITALHTGWARAIMSVPGHFFFGVMMGYYFALAKFQPAHKWSNLFKAFFVPMLMHGTFDALLMIPESLAEDGGYTWLAQSISGVLFIVFIIFDIKLWKWGIRRIKRLQELSQQQDFDRNKPFDNFTWNF